MVTKLCHHTCLVGAYYTVKTPHGLRIISLNTNLYYTSDKATVNVSDPADQLQWLNATLVNAKTSNERVRNTLSAKGDIAFALSVRPLGSFHS
ncbi:hypothetical protein DPMN_165920 [Dreissena polymorpha]|uniref:Uncharacterized protein n=1 Tax=Dreissena polymorpha TaxID=45954 RepID=A0A9D4ITP9_DREPO|nr:hypothetical protein DPMN_165920 [Dreissena polymorpha]